MTIPRYKTNAEGYDDSTLLMSLPVEDMVDTFHCAQRYAAFCEEPEVTRSLVAASLNMLRRTRADFARLNALSKLGAFSGAVALATATASPRNPPAADFGSLAFDMSTAAGPAPDVAEIIRQYLVTAAHFDVAPSSLEDDGSFRGTAQVDTGADAEEEEEEEFEVVFSYEHMERAAHFTPPMGIDWESMASRVTIYSRENPIIFVDVEEDYE